MKAIHINTRSQLRQCRVVDSCAGLMTPQGQYAYAGSAWEVSAEFCAQDGRMVREFRRVDGRTIIVLPVDRSSDPFA
jgi:hypothetical protein